LIRHYLDAVMRKDSSAIDRCFDSDAKYVVNGTPSLDSSDTLPPISNAEGNRAAAFGWFRLFGLASTAEQRTLTKYPSYHFTQFLTAFGIPACFRAKSDTFSAQASSSVIPSHD